MKLINYITVITTLDYCKVITKVDNEKYIKKVIKFNNSKKSNLNFLALRFYKRHVERLITTYSIRNTIVYYVLRFQIHIYVILYALRFTPFRFSFTLF